MFAGMLLSLGSFAQADLPATPSLELSGNFTPPRVHNISNLGLPPQYFIPNTNPRIILQIQPLRPDPLDYFRVNYLIIRGLNALVQETIRAHGDNTIPESGMLYVSQHTAIFAMSHLPGTLDLTYGICATLLRGIWEIVTLYGASVLNMDVYIGSYDAAHYRGKIALYPTSVPGDTA